MTRPTSSAPGRAAPLCWRTLTVGTVQILLCAAVLWSIIALWGAESFTSALRGLPWWSFLTAGALGGAGVLTQAARWRLIARHHAIDIGLGAAVARCWQAAFLNSVLPGGVAGDALRAADDSTDASADSRRGALAKGFASMAAERLVNTAVVFVFGAVVLLPRAPLAGAGCLVVAIVAAVISSRWLHRLPVGKLISVLVLSLLGWLCFAGLFVAAAAVLAPAAPLSVMAGSAAVALAAMSVPVGVGGWGVREVAVAWSFSLSGLSAAEGISVSVGYGALALASTLPGAAILAVRLIPRLRGAGRFVSQRSENS